jgi:hypothetical protein
VESKLPGSTLRRSRDEKEIVLKGQTMPRRHMHIEPSSSQGGGFVNNVEKIGKAAVQVGGAIHTMYQVGKGIGTVAKLAAPLLGFL